MGKLEIDLTIWASKSYPLDMEMAHLFVGGWGLGARLPEDPSMGWVSQLEPMLKE